MNENDLGQNCKDSVKIIEASVDNLINEDNPTKIQLDNLNNLDWFELTSLSDILQEYLRSGPSRLKWTCGLSRMMKAMSAGILPGTRSPSLAKVTLVPDFQPGFTLMVSTWRVVLIIMN